MKKLLPLLLLAGLIFSCEAQMSIRPNMQGFTPSLNLVFSGGVMPSGLTFTRTNPVSTRFNASGVLEVIGSNVARIDYDPTTLACKGLLIEEARTNFVLNSVFFLGTDGSVPTSWIARGLVSASKVSANTPIGNNYMRVSCGGGTVGASDDVRQQVAGLTSSTVYTISFYARLVSGSGDMIAKFGVPIPSFTLTSSWSRFSFQATSTGTTQNMFFGGPSGLVYDMANVQVEQGSFSTSYVPTTTAAVARSADACSIPAAGWFNPFQGSISIQCIPTLSGTSTVFSLNDGTANSRIDYRTNGTQNITVSGAAQTTTSTTALTLNMIDRIGLTWKTGSTALVKNGGTVATASTASIPVVTQLQLGGADGDTNSNLNGWIQKLVYYPNPAPNSFLQFLTQ